MIILGISCYYHDAAAAILRDGKLIAAAEEERFSRIKHDFGFPHHAIQFCLESAGIQAGDLDYAVFYEKPFRKFDRILMTVLQTYPKSYKVFRESMITWMIDKLWVGSKISAELGIPTDKILYSEHHMSHAASAFLCSPFDEAAILTVDGVGEWVTGTWGVGKGNQIDIKKQMLFPHSLGLLYSAFTAFLGFEVNEGEYKVMGMAPYGRPEYVDKVRKLIRLSGDGSFELDMDYFSFHHSSEQTYNRRFVELFGPPRAPESHFFTESSGYPSYFGDKPANYHALCRDNQHYADIAASIQVVIEEAVLNLARQAREVTGSRNLCMAGGVALNSVANGRVLREVDLDGLYIQPAAGDAGGALGAALFGYHTVLGQPRSFVMEHAYWGEEHGAEAIEAFLKGGGIRYERCANQEELVGRCVESLAQGGVLGWMQGRFEWGPRALGCRSILADPRRNEMKEVVNVKIKFREPFRPFAPSVLAERAGDYFEIGASDGKYPSRFMLNVAKVREAMRERVPATTHVDGSGRLQTVTRQTNPRYYALIESFGQLTGVPVLLNTSFNLRGEPIVNTPAQAYSTFARSGIDLLVLGDYLVRKDRI